MENITFRRGRYRITLLEKHIEVRTKRFNVMTRSMDTLMPYSQISNVEVTKRLFNPSRLVIRSVAGKAVRLTLGGKAILARDAIISRM